MKAHESDLLQRLDAAKHRHQQSLELLAHVQDLLPKADQRLRDEPENARKWRGVLDSLEISLDESKKRLDLAAMNLQQLERKVQNAQILLDDEASPSGEFPTSGGSASTWDLSVERTQDLNLEEASLLQDKMDSGEIQDRQLAASLELANQLGRKGEDDVDGEGNGRQVALRVAIEKIKQQQFDAMTLDEIKLVMACHTLLTSRLEPTSKDQRMKRILNGAIKILRRKRAELESQN